MNSGLDDTDKNFGPICLYCLDCTKFGPLIFNKIITIDANRCQTLRLKCSKFNFGCGSARDPAAGAYSAPRAPQLDLRGSASKFREESGRERRGREGRGGDKMLDAPRRWKDVCGGRIFVAPPYYSQHAVFASL